MTSPWIPTTLAITLAAVGGYLLGDLLSAYDYEDCLRGRIACEVKASELDDGCDGLRDQLQACTNDNETAERVIAECENTAAIADACDEALKLMKKDRLHRP